VTEPEIMRWKSCVELFLTVVKYREAKSSAEDVLEWCKGGRPWEALNKIKSKRLETPAQWQSWLAYANKRAHIAQVSLNLKPTIDIILQPENEKTRKDWQLVFAAGSIAVLVLIIASIS